MVAIGGEQIGFEIVAVITWIQGGPVMFGRFKYMLTQIAIGGGSVRAVRAFVRLRARMAPGVRLQFDEAFGTIRALVATERMRVVVNFLMLFQFGFVFGRVRTFITLVRFITIMSGRVNL